MPTRKAPAYLLHKPSGQARVRINGKDHYLGAYGSPESRERYEDLVTAWLRGAEFSRVMLTIDELVLMYLDFAKDFYTKGGKPTSEIHDLRAAMRPLVRLFGRTRARDFGPLKLKQVREAMVAAGWCRSTVNGQVRRVRRMFRWGVENEHVPPETLTALAAIAGLRRGKTAAPDRPPILPVADDAVDETISRLSPIVADMVRLQRLTGMRPAEVCLIRPCDVDRSGAEWIYRPSVHKTQHHGRARLIYLGPQAQSILRPYLLRAENAFCFSPAESEEHRRGAQSAARKTPKGQGNSPGTNRKKNPQRAPRAHYDKGSYRQAVHRACDKAFPVPADYQPIADLPATELARRRDLAQRWREAHRWNPNQLRHAFATKVRREHGLEAAQILLGHSTADVTQVYAERDAAKAILVARNIG